MIVRLWRGYTRPERADAYEALLRTTVIPGIRARAIAGFEGIELLRVDRDGEVEFLTIMRFTSLAAVRAFAGPAYETAVVPPAARELLARFDQKSTHYVAIDTTPNGGQISPAPRR
jgi:heme-degrading monooxygenase HmoA